MWSYEENFRVRGGNQKYKHFFNNNYLCSPEVSSAHTKTSVAFSSALAIMGLPSYQQTPTNSHNNYISIERQKLFRTGEFVLG